MLNYYDFVKEHPEEYKQFSCKELLFVICECPSDFKKSEDWSEHNCFVYIMNGEIIMHSRETSWRLKEGDTAFLKKGGCSIERAEHHTFCSLLFYVPDSYIRSFIRENIRLLRPEDSAPVSRSMLLPVEMNEVLRSYYESVISYFVANTQPPEDLLELKFRELLLNTIINQANRELKAYFQKLAVSNMDDLEDVMERNCLYNFQLHEYARLCHRSLSTFKRDFQTVYDKPPGRWLLEKRLEEAHHLLLTTDKPIVDVAADSGFANNTHFSRAFKSYFSISPLQCRRQMSSVNEHYS
jgi:AraC-like DNA-binding protein